MRRADLAATATQPVMVLRGCTMLGLLMVATAAAGVETATHSPTVSPTGCVTNQKGTGPS